MAHGRAGSSPAFGTKYACAPESRLIPKGFAMRVAIVNPRSNRKEIVIAKRQTTGGFGAMLSLLVEGGAEAAKRARPAPGSSRRQRRSAASRA